MQTAENSTVIRFGPFEADLRTRELRRNGLKLKLQEQPFQVLVMLLERAGELVTREEIRAKLWPQDTFLDFDHGLNAAVRRLREALNDNASLPKFVETLPRRGYRFIAAVQKRIPQGAPQPEALASTISDSPGFIRAMERRVPKPGGADEEGLPAHRHQPNGPRPEQGSGAEERAEKEMVEQTAKGTESRPSVWLGSWLWLAIVVLLLGTSAGVYVLKFRPSPRVGFQPPRSIVIADFENRTGDPVFEGTLRQGLAAQLDQSPFLYVFSDEQIARELRFMSRSAEASLTRGLAREVCERMGGVAVLNGSIAWIGNEYSLVLDAVNCSTGISLARAEAVASDKNRVLPALGTVASVMREKLGESLSTVRDFDAPIEQVTTPSLEALKAYGIGSRALVVGQNYDTSIASFQHAIALDPNFAMAYAKLGAALASLDIPADRYLAKAYSLRNRVSEREGFYISSHYFHVAVGDLQSASQVYGLWARTYPQDKEPPGDLGVLYMALGQYDKAVGALRHALDLPPPDAMDYSNLARCYIDLNRPDKAAATLEEARARGVDSPGFRARGAAIAFLRGNTAALGREEALTSGSPGIDYDVRLFRAYDARFTGQLSQTRDFSAQAVATAYREGNKSAAAGLQAEEALTQAAVGNAARARRLAMASLKISNARETEAIAGIALARAGDGAQARRVADDLAKRFPQDTIIQFEFLPTIRATVALEENNPPLAITDLQAASAYDLGDTSFSINLYPVYVRGLAFLAAHQGPQAAAEFQEIIDHPGIAINEVIVPLAHLGLARAYAMQGDNAEARAAYQDFLTLWKDADPDIPILKEAKAEYAKLH